MTTALPYGLRDVKLWPLNAATGGLGTVVDLPYMQTFSFSEAEEYSELRGDDSLVATRGRGANIEWELESGGISLEAYVCINGGSLVITGTGITEVKTYHKRSTDSRPNFRVEGQAMSESGGDFHVVIYNCKANDALEGELADGEFWISTASGVGMPLGDDNDLYEFIQNATSSAIDATPDS